MSSYRDKEDDGKGIFENNLSSISRNHRISDDFSIELNLHNPTISRSQSTEQKLRGDVQNLQQLSTVLDQMDKALDDAVNHNNYPVLSPFKPLSNVSPFPFPLYSAPVLAETMSNRETHTDLRMFQRPEELRNHNRLPYSSSSRLPSSSETDIGTNDYADSNDRHFKGLLLDDAKQSRGLSSPSSSHIRTRPFDGNVENSHDVELRHYPSEAYPYLTLARLVEHVALILMVEFAEPGTEPAVGALLTSQESPWAGPRVEDRTQEEGRCSCLWAVSQAARKVCVRAAIRLLKDSSVQRGLVPFWGCRDAEFPIDAVLGSVLHSLDVREEFEDKQEKLHELQRHMDLLSTTVTTLDSDAKEKLVSLSIVDEKMMDMQRRTEALAQGIQESELVKSQLIHDIHELKGHKSKLTEDIESHTQRLETLETCLRSALDKVKHADDRVSALQRQEQLSALRSENAAAQANEDEARLAQAKAVANEQLQHLFDEAKRVQSVLYKQAVVHNQKQAELQAIETETADIAKRTSEALEATREKIRAMDEEVDALSSRKQKYLVEIKELQERIKQDEVHLRSRLDDSRRATLAAEIDSKAAAAALETIQAQVETQKGILKQNDAILGEMEKLKGTKQSQLAQLQADIALAEREVDKRKMEATNDLYSIEQSVKRLSLELSENTQKLQQKRNELESMENMLRGLLTRLEDTQRKLAAEETKLADLRALTNAAECAYETVVAERDAAATSVSEIQSQRDSLFVSAEADLAAMRDLLESVTALQWEERRCKDSLAELEETRRHVDQEVEISKVALSELRDEISEKTPVLVCLKEDTGRVRSEHERLQDMLSSVQKSVEEELGKHAEALVVTTRLAGEADRWQAEVDQNRQHIGLLRKKEAELQHREAAVGQLFERVQLETQRLMEKSKDDKAYLEGVSAEKQTLSTDLELLKLEIQSRREELAAVEGSLVTARALWSDAESQRASAANQFEAVRATVEGHRRVAHDVTRRVDEERERLSTLQNECQTLEHTLSRLRKEAYREQFAKERTTLLTESSETMHSEGWRDGGVVGATSLGNSHAGRDLEVKQANMQPVQVCDWPRVRDRIPRSSAAEPAVTAFSNVPLVVFAATDVRPVHSMAGSAAVSGNSPVKSHDASIQDGIGSSPTKSFDLQAEIRKLKSQSEAILGDTGS